MPPLRPLLPAVGPWRPPPVADHPKRRYVALACENCRRHKSRCDGMPICAACVKRDSTCRYNSTETRGIRKKHECLQQRQSTYEDLIGFLRTMTEQDAVEVFRLLKAGTDVESIVKHVRDGNLLLQLSLIPETVRQYEFPYMTKMPSNLFISDNPYMSSCLYKVVSSSPAYTHTENRQLINKYGSAYMMPYNAEAIF